jgi:hypothetical protein
MAEAKGINPEITTEVTEASAHLLVVGRRP